jgi:ATP/maltotriose-dependent transcriptional regulator MalT
VREDLENYRVTLTWLLECGRPAEAADIAWGLKYFWLIRGRAAEGLQWYEQILTLPSLPPAAESRALVGAATMRYTHGELGSARTELTRALALALAAGDREMVAQAENMLGHVEHGSGNVNAARDRFAQSVEGYQALGNPSGTGNALCGMAAVALATGDDGQADHVLNHATSVLRRAAPWFLTWALYLRAVLAVRRAKPDEAIALVRESLTYIRELHDRFAFVYALVPLAAAAALKGDDAWAARILGARDAVTERTGASVVDKRVQDLQQQVEQEVRARLGADRWLRAYAAGRTASIDSLMKDIDSAARAVDQLSSRR